MRTMLLALLIAGCHPDVVPTGATCADAYSHVLNLGCPTDDGWVSACDGVNASEIVRLDIGCVMASKTCAAINGCMR